VTPYWREVWEERAAIMEFDGGMDREEAEAAAYADVRRMMKAPKRTSTRPASPLLFGEE